MPLDINNEISAVESQIESQGKLFDLALKDDTGLDKAKKIFREIKLLRSRLDELLQQKSLKTR